MSMPHEMESLRALEAWCRVECADYPNVDIKNTSTSFRDGLALCAIIHKHRPDLIDFHSLSKDNVYENNKLAFEVAETKLGIPALLDAKDMVSLVEPDHLSVITYLSQYYCFFTKTCHASAASLELSRVTELSRLTKRKPPETSHDHQPSREVHQYQGSSICVLCGNYVHLVQRQLAEGHVYHRSCFRCQVCGSTLLPGSYTQGSSAGFLICTVSEGSARPVPAPRRTVDTSTPPVPAPRTKTLQTMSSSSSTGNSPKHSKLPPSSVQRSRPAAASRIVKNNHPWMKMVHSGLWTQLPPAPPPVVPQGSWFKPRVAPPNPFDEDAEEETNNDTGEDGTKTDAANQSKHSDATSQPENDANPSNKSADLDSPAGSSDTGNTATKSKPDSKPKPTEEPSPLQETAAEGAAPPTPEAAQKDSSGETSTKTDVAKQSQLSDATSQPENDANPSTKTAAGGTAPPTPEAAQKYSSGETSTKTDVAKQSQLSDATSQPENDANPSKKTSAGGTAPPTSESVQNDSLAGSPDESSSGGVDNKPETADKPIAPSVEKSILAGAVSGLGVPDLAGESCIGSLADAASGLGILGLDELGVPDMAGAAGGLDIKAGVCPMGSSGAAGTLGTDVTQSLPFPKSASVPAISSILPTDLPEESESQLTQSKVQTDPCVPRGSLQAGELDTRLEKLELRGVELEKRLRDCQSGREEEEMLVDWFRLIHEKHMLVRTDAEVVYLTKQQSLEERQANVEYKLRCLLNRPEGEWSQEDKGQEQRLMDELVTVIEQRNQIVSGLDQDRKREKEEDMLLEAMMKRKDLQREGLKDLRKSKGKFKSMKMLKMLKVLSQKAEKKKS